MAELVGGGVASSERRDGDDYVVYRCYWPDAPAGEPWTALPQGATDRLIVHHSGQAALLPDSCAGKGGQRAARRAATRVWWRECDAKGHSVATGRVWGSAHPLWGRSSGTRCTWRECASLWLTSQG